MRGMKRDVNERKMGSKTSFGAEKKERQEERGKAVAIERGWTHSKSPGTSETRRRTSSRSSISSQGVQNPTTFARKREEKKKGDDPEMRENMSTFREQEKLEISAQKKRRGKKLLRRKIWPGPSARAAQRARHGF